MKTCATCMFYLTRAQLGCTMLVKRQRVFERAVIVVSEALGIDDDTAAKWIREVCSRSTLTVEAVISEVVSGRKSDFDKRRL